MQDKHTYSFHKYILIGFAYKIGTLCMKSFLIYLLHLIKCKWDENNSYTTLFVEQHKKIKSE